MNNFQKLYGIIGLATKAGKLTAGTEACLEGIEKRNIKLVLIATDASERTKKLINEKCEQFNVGVYEILSIEEISNAIGKPNKAIIGIKENGFAEQIKKIINGGEVIG